MNEDQINADREYQAIRKSVQGQPTVAQGAIRIETQYADAYQGLVRVGLAPQIKAKYRFTEVAHRR